MSLRALGLAAALLAAGCASAPPPTASTYADFLIGRIANLRDDHDVAADRYFRALARDPGDPTLIEGALRATVSAGDEERARRAARMAARDGGPALAHLVRSVDALRSNDWRAAARESQRVEGAASEELLARMLHIWARVGDHRVDDVLMQLQPLAGVRPYGGLFAYQQAMALDLSGRLDEALQAYATADASGMFLPAGIERHADALVRAGRSDEAAALVRRANAERNNPALAALASRLETAGVAAEAPLTPAKGAALGLFGLGAIFLQEHDPHNGLLAIGLALMLDPDLHAARLSFAEAHIAADQLDLARQALAQIPDHSPYATTARLVEAWALLDAGREEEALAVARARATTGDARALRGLADLYSRLERPAEAEALYSQLIAAEPPNWRLHFARGAAREMQGRWSEAEADLRRALELSPDQPEALNYLGYMWADRGERLHEALAMIRRAAELRPDSGAIVDSLGWVYFRMGDYEQALIHLERAVELEPAHPTLNEHLGDVYWRLGRRVEARFQWQRALSLDPDDPAALREKIERGLPPLPAPQSAQR